MSSSESSRRRIIVGVSGERSLHVIAVAGRYAEQFDADLVCVTIVSNPFDLGEEPRGGIYSTADTDVPELKDRFPARLAAQIKGILEPRGLSWSLHAAAGRPAAELSRIAEENDALMIIVGTREGIRGAIREALNGSVAMKLAHSQRRPLVIVPLDPVGADAMLLDRVASGVRERVQRRRDRGKGQA